MATEPLEPIIELLAGSLGDDTAREIVRREAQAMGLGPNVTEADRISLLRRIESQSGPAGLAARLALMRLHRQRGLSGSMPAVTNGPAGARPGDTKHDDKTADSSGRVSRVELVDLFAKSLGATSAEAIVKRAMLRTGLPGPTMTAKEATLVLDAIENEGGVGAAVARFAKVRFLLKVR
ncbi:MAG: hypothetical protein HOV80_15505 [Polyangiaceae bacterium]|nr:hypothetical protein [Polyangiaceae bacterium]